MIQYLDNHDTACYNGYTFRRDKKTGYYLSAKPICGKRKRLHVYVWENEIGEIQKGFQVHHKDRNKDNNEIENLELLSVHEHMSIHGKERAKQSAENVVKYAMPKAKEWHKSEQGREWHVIHGIEAYSKRKPIEYKCDYCGNVFETRNIYSEKSNKFCSNKCKAAFRRESGVDDVKKICKVCGGEYYANKYANTSRCEICKSKRNKKNRDC